MKKYKKIDFEKVAIEVLKITKKSRTGNYLKRAYEGLIASDVMRGTIDFIVSDGKGGIKKKYITDNYDELALDVTAKLGAVKSALIIKEVEQGKRTNKPVLTAIKELRALVE